MLIKSRNITPELSIVHVYKLCTKF